MIAEKLPLKFDVAALADYYHANVKHLEPIHQGRFFRGWSVLSASGDYRDGMQYTGNYYYTDADGNQVFDEGRARREVGYRPPHEHINLTQVATGCVADMIEKIREVGLKPRRGRWISLAAGGFTVWHRDAVDEDYVVRLHVPVITNPGCLFMTEEGSYHMEADGSAYLVAVNCIHKAVNTGTDERIHIFMDVIDDVGFSQHHQLIQHQQRFSQNARNA